MTVDEELTIFDDNVRRLKVEYDIYFGGGSKKPPADLEWRVQATVKKYQDGSRMNYGQRFRYNTIAQKYALFSSLWRQKLQVKEEGYRRPQDALLGVQGIRTEEEHKAAAELGARKRQHHDPGFIAHITDANADFDRVAALYQAMVEAKKKVGEPAPNAGFDSFRQFVSKKTEQIRQQSSCKAVEYSVSIEDGQVKLKAKAR